MRHIIKMPRILQTLFYLLKYDREQICERDTNKLCFKEAKMYINDGLFKAMANYNPFGDNKSEFKEYQKMAFLKKNLEGIDDDKVDEYDIVMGKLFRWVSMAIDLRCEDVVSRRDGIEVLKK